MTMHGKVECRPAGRARTLAAGHVLLAAAGLLLWKLSAGGSDSTFVEGISKVVSGETRQVQVHMQSLKIPVEKKYRFEGTTRAKYLKRLRHRRWCAQFTYPRTFGYVLKWNDTAGEGVVIDQEQTQKYLVIRDEIGSSYHAHKTLQPAEFVEFFATDEMDEVTVHRINKDWSNSPAPAPQGDSSSSRPTMGTTSSMRAQGVAAQPLRRRMGTWCSSSRRLSMSKRQRSFPSYG
ncbi:unnamed protein product [Symbiodinium microadriaticum]|nr:unnamed protein product [Symbiodinium microadriaticum]